MAVRSLGGGENGVIGRRGEKGVGGIARYEDLKGAGVMVSCRGIAVDVAFWVLVNEQYDEETKTSSVWVLLFLLLC